MAKYLREKPSNFKFSLHDAKIIDIDYDYGENRLIFKTQSGFIDIEIPVFADFLEVLYSDRIYFIAHTVHCF